MNNFLSYIPYCIDLIQNQLNNVLIYYSHVPVVVLGFLFVIYVLVKDRSLLSRYFITIVSLFCLWVLNDLVVWTLLYNSMITMFAWSTLELIEVLFFFFCVLFSFNFFFERDMSFYAKAVLFVPVLFVAYYTLIGQTLINYDTLICESTENSGIINTVVLYADLIYILVTAGLFIKKIFSSKKDRLKDTVFFVGTIFFLILYLSTLYISNYVEDYNWSLIALSGMPIFLATIGFTAVRFKIFDFKVVGTNLLIFSTIFLVATQFIFIQTFVNMILNSVTILFLLLSGYLLSRSVKKEIFLRESLQNANEEQENLIHFISHQVKGFFTKSRNIFSTIHDVKETIPQNLAPLVEEGLRSDKEGVQLVENILNAANLKTGKVTYAKEEFSLNQIIEEAIKENEIAAKKKDLKLNYHPAEGDDVKLIGDLARIKDVFMNLVQNSINYTFKGGVNVYVKKHPEKVEVIVKDTGVGLTPKDKENLFESGGRGEESLKYNVNSTGYGLFIAKKVIEEHAGKISADSAGRDKGSTFTVILPIK